MTGKIILTLATILLGIVVLAAGIALVTTIMMMIFFRNVWKEFKKEFRKQWKEKRNEDEFYH